MNVFSMKYTLTFLILFLLNAFTGSAQELQDTVSNTRRHYAVRGELNIGTLAYHHDYLSVLSEGYYPMFQADFLQFTDGDKPWQISYNFPEIGLSYYYTNMGGNPYLGGLHALFPFIDFPIVRGRCCTLYYRLGLGIGVIEKPYDVNTNPDNLALASYINAFFNMGIKAEFKLSNRVYLTAGAVFSHASNGTTKEPNTGVNIPSVSLGVAYRLDSEELHHDRSILPEFSAEPWHVDVGAFMAAKDMLIGDSPIYFVGALSSNITKRYRYTRSWGGGIDVEYDQSDIPSDYYGRKGDDFDPKNIRPSIKVLHQWHVGGLTIGVEFGAYIYKHYKVEDKLLQKLTLSHSVGKNLSVGILLKTHWASADYIAAGCRYRI